MAADQPSTHSERHLLEPLLPKKRDALMIDKSDRYGALLVGELMGVVLGAGVVMVVIGNPYVGLVFLLVWLSLHLTAGKALRG
jgi:hypothetical protein